MKAPSREKIETTKGTVEIRAFTRKEANDIQKISRKQKLAKTDKERFDLEDQQEAILVGCIVTGNEFLDDIEAGEYMAILNKIAVLSREYKEKN
jgi:hypothetical protein